MNRRHLPSRRAVARHFCCLRRAQAFLGRGCATPPLLSCACTHFTDFAPGQLPVVEVANLQQLLALSPLDLVTKLRSIVGVLVARAPLDLASPKLPGRLGALLGWSRLLSVHLNLSKSI